MPVQEWLPVAQVQTFWRQAIPVPPQSDADAHCTHMLAEHLFFVPVHAFPHKPQFAGSLVVLMQALLHAVDPASQAAQRLFLQIALLPQSAMLAQSALQTAPSQWVPDRQSPSTEQDVLQVVADAHVKPLQSFATGVAHVPLPSQVDGPR